MYISESDIKFAKRTLSDFVNGEMSSPKTVAAQMANDHRYLQQEMFKICYEYIRILAMNYEHNQYDPRNEWACETANKMLSNIDAPELAILPYEWDEYEERKRAIYNKSF